MEKIRLMREQDLESVVLIEKSIFTKPWSQKAFFDSLVSDNTLYVVVEEDGIIKAYCGMYLSYGEGNITNVAVGIKYRGQRIAYRMINEILKMAKQKETTDVFLEVRKSNTPAIRLYEKLGFVNEGMRKNFYDKPTEDAVIMWKHNL